MNSIKKEYVIYKNCLYENLTKGSTNNLHLIRPFKGINVDPKYGYLNITNNEVEYPDRLDIIVWFMAKYSGLFSIMISIIIQLIILYVEI